MYFLDVTGPHGGRTIALPSVELRIGSGSDCDVQLDGPGVAHHHATLIERAGAPILLDVGASTITINDQPVAGTALLLTGCVIAVGSFRMRFRIVDLPPDTIQTQTLRQPTAPPIPMADADIEILSRWSSTPTVVSSELLDSEVHVSTDPSIPAAEPALPDEESQSEAFTVRPWTKPMPRSLRATQSAVEIEFLRALRDDADVNAARAVYADWLEERGEAVRAEYLRLLDVVAASSGTDAQRRQLAALGARIANTWRALVLPPAALIERCAVTAAYPGQVRRPRCPRAWGALDRTEADDFRRCSACASFVQYASTVDRAANAIRGPVVVDLAESRAARDLVPPSARPTSCCPGRRTSRVDLPSRGRVIGPNKVSEYFGECARLESLAVTAFSHLHDDLTALGAPASLRRRALEAARDETEHVGIMDALAGHASGWLDGFDAAAAGPVVPRLPYEVARENAVEGCVRETFAALVARHQATRAMPATRLAMEKIANDEARHAALSWDVARWLEPRLPPRERGQIVLARRDGMRELLAETAQPVDAELVAVAGCPDRKASLALARTVARRVDAFDRAFVQ